ncbi:hypothetical protein CONLIGDRAFT_344063 [Coniochaeta ligniaria NRRL 30616]|uniref:LPXTG-domain-containing protein n=1 Tax=Coniochaeta ligniaria NRRL 30616 TaxID=1408157 RepID=A0A1J7J8Z5_9PEZI|nr:hypothetical protein CONLIGDRAFT_344063 [Coniochaeta ligniaria NRRL 30616]
MRTTAVLFALVALLKSSSAILVARGSPCEKNCGNVLDATHGDDLVCDESQYASSSAGAVFQGCTRCELGSNYTADGQTDLQWMAYNLRYAMSYCLFGDFGNKAAADTPCITTTACGPLKKAFEWNNLTTTGGAYDYCQEWNELQAGKCSLCLQAGEMHYLNNFVVMLNATCLQKPAPGKTISVAGDPFSTRPMNVTTPTQAPLYTYIPDITAVPIGARVGIAAAGIIVLLATAGCCIIWNGKRRRRRFLRDLEKRHADAGWPHPKTRHGGSDMLETPASQKPLRGWDDTPVSAATDASADRSLGRYFSPYSSTYNSPVSAMDGPAMRNWPTLSPQKLTQVQEDELAYMRAQDEMIRHQQEEQRRQLQQQQQQPHPPAFTQWPSSTQEKLMQMQHEREQQALTGVGIGLALGGDEASLRSKPSNPQLDTASLRSKNSDPQFSSNNPYGGSLAGDLSQPYRTYHTESSSSSSPAKGKSRGSDEDEEAYEMHEVPSSGGGSEGSAPKMPAAPQAPVLHHPGYGRQPSLRRTGTGGSSRTGVAGGLTEEDARRGNAL